MRPNTRLLLRKRALLRVRARRVLLAVRRRVSAAAAFATNNPHRRSLLFLTPPPARQQSIEGEEQGATEEINIDELHQAIRAGHTQVVKDVLEGRRQQRQRTAPGAAAVAEAISAVNENGDTCIHIAAKMGYAEIVSVLLNKGAETNGLGSRSRTPLQLASIYGHLEAVEVLLDAGADATVSLRDESGYEHVSVSVSPLLQYDVVVLNSCVQARRNNFLGDSSDAHHPSPRACTMP